MRAIKEVEGDEEKVQVEKLARNLRALELEEREIEVKKEQSRREASVLKILRIRTPPPEGVLMRLLNAYFCRLFVNKRLNQ